ncbi:MAG: hypothetical protein K6E54_08590 [Bacteroidaceae bacterium]|jgi:hypothetical protein|nr:hypothetical protein [Bacteroidaceae bacterium]
MPNLYIRYFDREAVVSSIDEAMYFLESINEIKIETNVAGRIQSFLDSNNTYPFRLKVSYSNYVLFLKTDAVTLDEFKMFEQMRKEQKTDGMPMRPMTMADRKRSILDELKTIHPGWYEGSLLFKRVVMVPGTGKFEYQDTRFTVRCKADCALECYDRMIDNLKCRKDVDQRSQFPSAKSNNFSYKFLCDF